MTGQTKEPGEGEIPGPSSHTERVDTAKDNSQVHVFSELGEERVPLFCKYPASFVFVESVVGPGLVKLDAEALHIIEFN